MLLRPADPSQMTPVFLNRCRARVALPIARERVDISTLVFTRVRRLPIGTRTRKIPAGELEELPCDSDAVNLRTDRTTCRIGFVPDSREHR